MNELDQAVLLCGLPKHGKTTEARRLAKAHLERYPTGYVLVHDRHAQFSPDITRAFKDTAEWRAELAAAAAEKKPFPRGASFRCSATEISKLAIELGEKHNNAKHVRVPMMVIYDESSLMDSSGPTHMDALDVDLFSNRRHYGIAPVYNVQRPGALMEAFFTQSTEVYIFSQPSEKWTHTLEERLGLRGGELDFLVGGPKFRYVLWRQGEGLVTS